MKQNNLDTGVDGGEINKGIALFGSLNPNYEVIFKRKNQRDAVQLLLNKYGLNKLERLVQGALLASLDPFGPTITTPQQMVDKLGALIIWGNKRNSNNKVFSLNKEENVNQD